MAVALIRTVFAQDTKKARRQWRIGADQLRSRFPKVGALMDQCEADVLAFKFPKVHRLQIHSTNPLERLNADVKPRTDVVGIFEASNGWRVQFGGTPLRYQHVFDGVSISGHSRTPLESVITVTLLLPTAHEFSVNAVSKLIQTGHLRLCVWVTQQS